MTSSRPRLLALYAFLLFLASPLAAQFDPGRLARVDSFLSSEVAKGTIPNAQALVIHRGRTVLRSTHGYADLASRRPARPDDIYRIVSQTKALVSVGLMMLFEEGRFQLEDPVGKYLPAFAAPRVLVGYDSLAGRYLTRPAERPLTIRHLLSHTAGIGHGLPQGVPDSLRVPIYMSLGEESLAEVTDRLARWPLLHEPGAAFTYGLGSDVVARLVEVLSGQPLDEFLAERLFRPLGMTDSYFYLPASKHDRLVTVYSRHGGPDAPLTVHENEHYRDFALRGAQRLLSGSGGTVGTIDDYARFCRMILAGGSLDGHYYLNPRTVALMAENQIGEHTVWERGDKFGLGFQIIGPGSRYGDLASPGSLLWGGLFCSEFTIDPAEELICLVYTNVAPLPQYGEIVRKFRTLVYAALE